MGKPTGEQETITTIEEYLKAQNRPHNVNTIVENLRGKVKKSAAQRALDELSKEGKVIEKEYGKQKIYLVSQEQFDVPPAEELKKMDAEIAAKREELAEITGENNKLAAKVRQTEASLTNEQVAEKVEFLEKGVKAMQARIDQFKNSDATVSEADVKKLDKDEEFYYNCWRKRRRMCMDVVDMISESADKKVKTLCDEIGIETDKAAKVDLAAFAPGKK